MTLPTDWSADDYSLTLSLVAESGHYRVTLRETEEANLLVEEIVPAFEMAAFAANYLAPLAAFVTEDVPIGLLESLGRELAARLLPAGVRAALFAVPAAKRACLRLRLNLAYPALACLPWECVYLDPAHPQDDWTGFLSLHPGVHLARQAASLRPVGTLCVEGLRLLLVCANPGSPRYGLLLRLEAEANCALAALRNRECRRITVEVLRDATPIALQKRLIDWQPHILHFMGHGDERPSGGVLVLQGEKPGTEALLYGDSLAGWLAQTPARLVVLSACHTASPVRGVAQTLAASGIPAVVAMQLPLRDTATELFARAFYGALTATGLAEEAVKQGRQAIRGMGADWGVPALYLSTTDGRLFRQTEEEAPFAIPDLRNLRFVGRENVLAEIQAALSGSEPRPVALVGMGGLGKTQLAVEYAHRHRADHPAGVFWINAKDAQRMKEDYASLGRFFNVPESLSAENRAERVRDRLQQLTQPCLLIFDNLTDETDLRLLPSNPRCRLLVTTRKRYLVRGRFHVVSPAPLDDESALALLQSCRPARGDADFQAARDIAQMLGALPLALTLIAHYVERHGLSFEACRERLETNRLELLRRATPRSSAPSELTYSIEDAINISREGLAPPALALLETAACFAGRGVPIDLLFAASDMPSRDDCEEALADLIDSSLVTREQDNRLSLHELIRLFARQQTTGPARALTLERVAAVLTEPLQRANAAWNWSQVRENMDHCRMVAHLCSVEGVTRNVAPLLLAMGIYLREHGEEKEALRRFEQGLDIVEGLYGKRHLETAEFLNWMGVTIEPNKRKALVYVREACAIARRLLAPDDPLIADYYINVGYVLKLQGSASDSGQTEEDEIALTARQKRARLRRAMAFYVRALQINEAAFGHAHASVALSLSNIGMLLLVEHRAEEALAYLEEAYAIDREVFGPQSVKVAIRLNNIGMILMQLDRPMEALRRHREALGIYEQAYGHRRPDVADSLKYLGAAYRALNQRREARDCYEEAAALYADLDGPQHRRTLEAREALQTLAKEISSDAAG